MKRFLIFICLYPGVALLSLGAFISIEISALPDNPEAVKLVGWAYVVGVVPALVCAAVDWLLRKTRLRFIGTTLVGYAIGLLIGLAFFDWGLVGRILAFALIGAIPAAVCSWLSNSRWTARRDTSVE